MKQPLQTTLFKALFFTALTAISILAFLPDYDALPPIVSFSDLLNHTIAFAVLFVLATLAYPSLLVKQIIVVLIAYAFFIEVVQYFLPTRFASWSDIGADIAGLIIGYAVMIFLRRLPYIKILFN